MADDADMEPPPSSSTTAAAQSITNSQHSGWGMGSGDNLRFRNSTNSGTRRSSFHLFTIHRQLEVFVACCVRVSRFVLTLGQPLTKLQREGPREGRREGDWQPSERSQITLNSSAVWVP